MVAAPVDPSYSPSADSVELCGSEMSSQCSRETDAFLSKRTEAGDHSPSRKREVEDDLPPRERYVRVFSSGQRVAIMLLLLSVILVSALTQLEGPSRAIGGWTKRDTSFEALSRDLRGRKVVMIGDSVMRYKYLTLVSFLETGVKLSSLPGANETTSLSNNRVVENTWASWHDFFNVTTFSPQETCDCWRAERGAVKPKPEHIKENRRYLSDGYDISYYQLLEVSGVCAVHGHTEAHAQASPHETAYDWCFSFPGFMEFVTRTVQPDILFLNTGLWGPLQPSAVESIVASIPRLKKVVWFKTTNTRGNHTSSELDAPLTKHFANYSNVAIADAWSIGTDLVAQLSPEKVHWDKLHFFAFAYEVMLQDALQHALLSLR